MPGPRLAVRWPRETPRSASSAAGPAPGWPWRRTRSGAPGAGTTPTCSPSGFGSPRRQWPPRWSTRSCTRRSIRPKPRWSSRSASSTLHPRGAEPVVSSEQVRGRAAAPLPRSNRPTLDQERSLWRHGHRWVAGMDEVGRGAWAGPVTVGVAVLPPGVTRATMPRWLRDSKLLHEVRREAIFDAVAAWCACWAVGHASAAECDRWGMTAALRLAAYRALAGLPLVPDALVVDGPRDLLKEPPVQLELSAQGAEPERPDVPEVVTPATVVPVVDGDARCASVSAA